MDCVEAEIDVVDGLHAGKSQGGWSHVVRCRSIYRVQGKDNDETRSHRRPGALLWVELSRNWSIFHERPYHWTPKEVSGLLFMQTDCCAPWRYTDVIPL